ncbi:MAG: protocatechuate 3,4-dioxygenase subunit alpha [Brevundimonas sp.]|uniref:protocatechuate 3,4-dioxygenase subunit alpha n=1 Tax=Brevundimonas sp. TaxID=1871086 RepID=UPI00272208B9|nr:protocatechuate 3,4-dioxygenase subunit alpha [Brevundimonas sp.]MDO9607916.1 protocatechuate 3,4-dioxygenase subunit alpha [Brevundimonas sp.]
MAGQTPWQTVGPYFHYGLAWKGGADLIEVGADLGARMDLIPEGHYVLNPNTTPRGKVTGESIEISGVVYDADGAPVTDAMIEIWQANSAGRYADPQDDRADLPLDQGFIGFGRSSTDQNGVYRFRTVKPGRAPGPGNGLQAPHIAVGVQARGVIKRLCTRLYFADEASNAEDPILALVPEDRRATLIATPVPGGYRLDIRLQGADETVFFDV